MVSNNKHPFNSEECLVVLVTTTEREEAVPLPDQKFMEGGLPKESYASPWTITTLKLDDLQQKIGSLNQKALEEIENKIEKYIELR